jgi:hypothetical protein
LGGHVRHGLRTIKSIRHSHPERRCSQP